MQMASKSSSCRATLAVGLGSRFCNSAVAFFLPVSRSNSKSDEVRAPEKSILAPSHTNTPVPSHASAFAPAKSILALKYSKADLMRILKIFLETKDQEPKTEIPRK